MLIYSRIRKIAAIFIAVIIVPIEAWGVSSDANWQHLSSSDGSAVTPRHESGGVQLNGRIYVIGGRGSRSVSVYDPSSESWAQKTAPPIVLNHFQAVAFADKIWILGAFTGNYPAESSVADIYTYTPASDSWAKAGTIPETRRRGSAAAVLHNGLIYLVGGNTNGHRPGAQSWFDSYNPLTGEWQVLEDAPTARDHATVSITNSRLVVAAGRQTAYPDTFGNTVSATDVFDFRTGNWSTGSEIPTERAGTMTVAVGNEVIVIGGETKGFNYAREHVEAYNVVTDSWRQLSPLQVGRHGGVAAVMNSAVHVVSGSERKGGAPESTVHEKMLFNSLQITSPNTGSKLSATQTFQWQDDGSGVLQYWLTIGSRIGSADYFSSGNLGVAKSVIATGLPGIADTKLYTRLWYRYNSTVSWQFFDAAYTAAGSGIPYIISHTPSDPFTNTHGTETIEFNGNGTAADRYWVYAGSVKGGKQYYDSGLLTNTQATVTSLPTNGSRVWIRLWYLAYGSWQFVDNEFVTANFSPTVDTSRGDEVLTHFSDTFIWNDPSDLVTEWWLYAGSTMGARDYEDSGSLGGSSLYTTLNGNLPAGSVPVYVRLWYRQGTGHWKFVDKVFTSAL